MVADFATMGRMNRVSVVTCGPAVNESERTAIEGLKTRLISAQPEGAWLLLTNLPFSATHGRQSDEIDILAIGPPGVRVVEVKHWGAAWAKRNADVVEQEADKVTSKARKVGTTLRRHFPEIGRVDGAFLLTESAARVKGLEGPVRGVSFHTLKTWQEALNYDAPSVLSAHQVRRLGATLTPKSRLATDGHVKRLAGYTKLRLQTPAEERFHRVFTATHSSRRDQVILHLYDCSASDDANAESKARREFDALHRLQQYGWAPRIVDSFQPAPGYHGEVQFFTVADPGAPTIQERASDSSWSAEARLAFARSAVRALHQLHQAGTEDQPLLHRNLMPETLLVKHDNSPVIIGFHQARIPSEATVGTASMVDDGPTTAPEVQAQGRAAADRRSDVYSMCASLMILFEQTDHQVVDILAQGTATTPSARQDLSDLSLSLARLLGEEIPAPPTPPVRFWTEEQQVRFEGHEYRIVSRLGSGGIGTTFKVVELDPKTGEDLGAYVAKAIHHRQDADRVMDAYRLVRPHSGDHPALSTVYQYARDWQDNGLSALLTWVEGEPLDDYAGLMSILAEDHHEVTDEALAIRWLKTAASALGTLHRSGLVHGDVSPRNMIVSGSDVVLTDYDCVTKVGERYAGPGTVAYCSPSFVDGAAARPSDDIYALAASFFHVLFERQPFQYDGNQSKDRGLNWADIDRDVYPSLAPFLERATATQREERYATIGEALADLAVQVQSDELLDHSSATQEFVDTSAAPRTQPAADSEVRPTTGQAQEVARTPNEVPWLKSLLQSYPGSPLGNSETRGLDSEFADETYVETELEEALFRDVMERRISLVVLCGNAGDGKTALLQHLANRFGLGHHTSAKRILEGDTADGLTVRMNLDGSASWQGRSANDLLDECFGPFHDGAPQSEALFLAINDGRLLEWIEDTEDRSGETRLTKALLERLEGEATSQEPHIRFVNLNERSLVGRVAEDGQSLDTSFLEELVYKLYRGEQAEETWKPCLTCAARDICEVYPATRLFGPSPIPGAADEIRDRARNRLFEALQAVHLRGETHITMRELRAALVYILFGTRYCDDYHQGHDAASYADRAFSPQSPARQGEVLADLVRYDPGIETHPKIDRYLSQTSTDNEENIRRYPHLEIPSARRHAYFEWTEQHLDRVANDQEALGLAQGRHLRLFRDLAIDRDANHVADVTRRLCAGISRLESLPPQALDRQDVVPLRITPRTPTETAFWVDKPLANFRLEIDEAAAPCIEHLHRQAFLVYRYEYGRKERLRLGADLFHLLLDLADGFQLGDVSTDDTFAQLSIFVQRLMREDHHRCAIAWNPMKEHAIFDIAAVLAEQPSAQTIEISVRTEEVTHG